MNRFQVMSELQRCVEKTSDCEWAVWIRGKYLGSIKCDLNRCFYRIISAKEQYVGSKNSFASALGQFIETAEYVIRNDEKASIELWIDAVTRETVFRRWGVSKKKTIWQKVKGWFK